MKTGVIGDCVGLAVKCPDCGNALSLRAGSMCIFYISVTEKSATGWCDSCSKKYLIPDLSTLKVVDAGLFQEMLDDLNFIKSKVERYTQSSCVLFDINTRVSQLISKAEKA